jgi:hypothetical protein
MNYRIINEAVFYSVWDAVKLLIRHPVNDTIYLNVEASIRKSIRDSVAGPVRIHLDSYIDSSAKNYFKQNVR